MRSAVGAAVGLLALLGGCRGDGGEGVRTAPIGTSADVDRNAARGRLEARPSRGRPDREPSGLRELLAQGVTGLLHVPAGYSPSRPAPLVVLLHGAGSDERSGLGPLAGLADETGLLLLSPKSRGRTWDVILDDYGPDVAAIDALLGHVFARFAVDSSRLAIGGFSDGASYALGVGLANGGLFSHLIAFSPGFVPSDGRRGRPEVFVSHGVEDPVLPIDRSSRLIVPALRRERYPVAYREFDGGHRVPPDIARAAVAWLTRRGG